MQMTPVQPYPLRFLRNLNRGREIASVLFHYGFGDVVQRLGLAPYLNWGNKTILRKKREAIEHLTTPCRIRMALEELGPSFIKFGQVLSTRPDLIPADVIEELKQLQEKVSPFAESGITQQVEQEFQQPITSLFRDFTDTPLAAGSLAQVHLAVSLDGRPLVVKIRRPNVVQHVERDLSVMVEMAMLLEKHVPESRVFDPSGLVKYFSRTIRRELNFLREGRSLQEFGRMFEDDPRLHVPTFEADYQSESMIVMERIDGIKVDDIEGLRQSGIDPRQIAINGVSVYLRQAFEFGKFHGDPHPGNIRVRSDGVIVMLDYGMVGYLDEERRDMLVDLFVAIARQDVDLTVSVLMKLSQTIVTQVDTQLLQADVRDFLEAYYGVPLKQIKISQLLTDFLNIMASHGLHCPGDLMLLIRACITLEGIGRTLDPQFNMAEQLTPFVEKMMRERYKPKRVIERAFQETKALAKCMQQLPLHLGNVLKRASEDDLKLQLEHRGLDHLISEFDRSSNRVVVGMVISAMVVATALIIRTTATHSYWFALPLFLLSGFLGIWLIWGIFRSGRL